MILVRCDSCKKTVTAPRSGVTFVSLYDKDLCMACAQKLTSDTSGAMAREKSFHLKNYEKNQKPALNLENSSNILIDFLHPRQSSILIRIKFL